MTTSTYPARRAPGSDVDEILHLNREWWEANIDLDTERMVKVFPSPGEELLMFNFNGHPYFTLRELVALWDHYRALMGSTGELDVQIMRLDVRGDTAWLGCEVFLANTDLATEGREESEWTVDSVDTPWCRATEIYHRDDGAGRPQWRMWHTHISALADPKESRPGFADTVESRGLGWVPWTPLPERLP